MDSNLYPDQAGQLAALLRAWSASPLLRQQYHDDLSAYLRDAFATAAVGYASPLPPISLASIR